MKNKCFRRIFGVVFALALLLSCIGPASAVVIPPVDTDAVREYLSGTAEYPRGIYAVMRTGADVVVQQDVPNTTVYHVVGTGVSMSIPGGQSYTASLSGNLECNGAAQLGADIAASAGYAFASSLFGQLNVEMSVTFTPDPNITYTLDANAEEGEYCLTVFFPGKEVVKQVTGINANQLTWVLWEETIEFAPVYDVENDDIPYVAYTRN